MTYTLKIDPKFPLFSEHTPVKTRKYRYDRPDGSTYWGECGGEVNRAPLYVKRERPKMMKKLLRVVKKTKGHIVSVRSQFCGASWAKIIEVR